MEVKQKQQRRIEDFPDGGVPKSKGGTNLLFG